MYITSRIKINEKGEKVNYIFVDTLDDTEFGKEFMSSHGYSNFFGSLKEFVTKKFKEGDIAYIVVNGVLIGSVALGIFFTVNEEKVTNANSVQDTHTEILENTGIKEENVAGELTDEQEEIILEAENYDTQDNSEETLSSSDEPTSAATNSVENITVSKSDTSSSNSNVAQSSSSNVTQNISQSSSSNVTTNASTSSTNETSAPKTEAPQNSANATNNTNSCTITLNNGGNITKMYLEEYIIGVVAAEMPASFNLEALKAQAVAARTYAVKKTSAGATLVNSTANQVYKTNTELKTMWGSSYSTYYNKVKTAVEATKGKVLTYNGAYIEALYHSMSNGKTELPSYVWGSSYPYLQSVNSSWDRNVSEYEKTTYIPYSTVTSKLGFTVSESTEITVISKTVSDRVENIKIGNKTYSGVSLRSTLGLRSADFTIEKTASGINVTTRGYGHGVGMSQYGANEAAKEGYTYTQILNHYYPSATLSGLNL